MKASLQNRIAPPSAQKGESMSDAKVAQRGEAIDSTGPKEKVDFGNVLFNSNVDTKKERDARANGDLSSATGEEFLQKLADQTKQDRSPKNKLGKDDFLKLFVTQLKNQDPLNPDDGAEMAAKLAQFNSLEQLMNVNKSLEKMATAQNTNRSMMLSNFIGKQIEVEGGRTKLEGSKITDANFKLNRGAKNASLQVRDTSGTLIAEKDLGSMPPGQHQVSWDGTNKKGNPVANGIYTFSVMALDAEGKDIPVDITSKVTITGIDINDANGAFYTNYGRVKLDNVKAVGEEGFYHYDRNAVKDSNLKPTPNAKPAAPESISGATAQAEQKLPAKRPFNPQQVKSSDVATAVAAKSSDTKKQAPVTAPEATKEVTSAQKPKSEPSPNA